MRFSQNFAQTKRNISTEIESINARLLIQAGFIHQEMAGVYSYLPLGLRVLTKIETIVRRNFDKIGVEILMPTLSPKSIWETTGRIGTVDVMFKASGANQLSLSKNDAEYIINYSHEEIITPLVSEYARSYKDLPRAIYQIQTKFRNEPRAKSGLLRGREFRMKDLYSFHATADDLKTYYQTVQQTYLDTYKDLGIGDDTFLTFASGGDFTSEYSHEFQTVLPSGEDTIYLDRAGRVAYNKEVATVEDAKKLGVDITSLEEVRACEVGNIFPLGTKYSKAFNYTYIDESGNPQLVEMGCYGLGTSRVMGVIVEKFADDKGLVWPSQIAPFQVHLIGLDLDDPAILDHANQIYDRLIDQGIEAIFDDRTGISAGEKFIDADLIGIPYRAVVSKRTGDQIEVKSRTGTQTENVSFDVLVSKLK